MLLSLRAGFFLKHDFAHSLSQFLLLFDLLTKLLSEILEGVIMTQNEVYAISVALAAIFCHFMIFILLGEVF